MAFEFNLAAPDPFEAVEAGQLVSALPRRAIDRVSDGFAPFRSCIEGIVWQRSHQAVAGTQRRELTAREVNLAPGEQVDEEEFR